MDFIRKNKVAIGTVAVGAGVAGLIYYLLYRGKTVRKSSHSKGKYEGQPTPGGSHRKIFMKDKIYQEMIAKLKRTVDSEKSTGTLSKVSLTGICKAIFHLFKPDYLSNYEENRHLRRKYLSSMQDYATELSKSATANETLMDQASSEVLKDLGINQALYDREFDRVSHEDSNFQLFTTYMLENMKAQVPTKSPARLTKEMLADYFKFQVDVFGNYSFKDVKDATVENQTIWKQTYLSDMAAMKFKFEEEDLIREPLLLNDPEVTEHRHQLQELINKERQTNISFPY